jgi:hypothetical protein
MIESEFRCETSGLCKRTVFASYGAPEVLEDACLGARSRRSLVRSRAAEISLREAKMKHSWRQLLAGMRHLCHILAKRSSIAADFDWLIEIIIISSSRSGSQQPVYPPSLRYGAAMFSWARRSSKSEGGKVSCFVTK